MKDKDNAFLIFAITGGAATLFSLFICALGLWWSGALGLWWSGALGG